MKKKILIALIVILVLIGGVFAYLLMNLNGLIEKYRPELERIASQTLGSKVKMGKLEASVFPDTSINISEFALADIENQQDGFKLKNLILHLKPMALLSGKLEITELSINSPSVTAIKDQNGVTIPGLSKTDKSKKDGSATPTSEEKPTGQPKETSSPGINLDLQKFEIQDANVTLKDIVAGKTYSVSGVSVLAAVTLNGDVAKISNLKLDGKLLGAAPVALKGNELRFNLKSGQINAPDLEFQLLRDAFAISADIDSKNQSGQAKLKSDSLNLAPYLASDSPFSEYVPPAVKSMDVKGIVKPNFNAEFSKDAYKATGFVGLEGIAAKSAGFTIANLGGKITVNADKQTQQAASQDLILSLNGAPVTVKFNSVVNNKTDAQVKDTEIKAFSGLINFSGDFKLAQQIGFETKTNIVNLQMGDAIRTLKPDMPDILSGTLSKMSSSVAGHTGPNLMQSLKGTASFVVSKAVLKGINLAGKVLQSVNDIPLISGALYSLVPENKRGLVSSENTEIESVTANVKIENGGLTTNDLKLVSSFFTLEAQGRIGFDTNLDLNATIIFSPEFSKSMIGAVKEAKSLLDDQERLVIPLTISGIAPKLIIIPNVRKLVEAGTKKAVKEKAGKLLDQVLGEGKGNSTLKDLGGALGF